MKESLETEPLSINALLFLREVEKRPELYKGDPLDRVRKLQLWTEIAEVVFKDWSELSRAAIHDRIVLLQRKWKSFRDTYSREIRLRKAGRKNRKVYKYYKHLKFLGRHDDVPKHPDDDDDDVDADDGIYFQMEDVLDEGTFFKEEPDYDDDEEEPKPKPKKRRAASKKQKPKKKRVPVEFQDRSFTEDFPTVPAYAEDDGDRLFMLSFLSEMKKLPVNIKMWARSQISNVMQEAVMSSLNNTAPGVSGTSYENKFEDRAPNLERQSSSSSD